MARVQTPHLQYETDRLWENYHQNLHFTPKRYYDVWNHWDDNSTPDTHKWEPGLKAIQRIIQDAEHDGVQVRALGAGWSLSNAARTHGYLVNTRPLNIIEIGLSAASCDPNHLFERDKLVFAQCGATIAELNVALESNGLSLSTSGASNGQTICGALSTGTHGAAWKFGAVQEFVVGIHLISEGGKGYWIERKTDSVVSQHFVDVLDGPGATKWIQDDDMFNAVVVSFGSFGIIHAVLLRAESIYLLERHVVPCHYAEVLPVLQNPHLMAQLNLPDIHGNVPGMDPYHFEVWLNPFSFAVNGNDVYEIAGEKAAYVRYMYKLPAASLSRYSPTGKLIGLEPDCHTLSNDAYALFPALGYIEALLRLVGLGAANDVLKFVLDGQLSPSNGVDHHGTILTHGGTFDASGLAGHGMSCELGFDPAHLSTAISIIIRKMLEFPFASFPAIRFVKSSDAFLAFTKFRGITSTIEFPAPYSWQTQMGYERMWKALAEQVDFTFHWGQCQKWGDTPTQARDRIRQVFDEPGGNRLDKWRQQRHRFLVAGGLRTFANPLLKECGIAD